jgi:CubicO group peptidase (beta-lactamase class C family)
MTTFFSRTSVKALLLSAFLPFLTAASAFGGKAEPVLQINYDSVKESVSQLIQSEMKKNDIVGLSIALVDDQRVVWTQGFGYANERKDIAATPETVYRIGSLTKVFTAASIMQLVEQDKLNIEKPLKTYLPEFSIRTRFGSAAPITLRNLLTHHSGLPSDYQKGMWSKKPGPFTRMVDLLKDEYAAYPPGFIFSYSNVGYDLLGSVIERATGQDYGLSIQNSLLYPLGMRNSGFTPPALTWLLSAGYYRGSERDDPPLRDLPAGGMYSTVLDLSRFVEMVFANGVSNGRQIMQDKTLTEMFRPQNSNVPLDLDFRVGLGWMLGGLGEVDIRNAGLVAHHAGSTLMFRSQLIVLPRHKLGAVVLANTSTAGATVSRIAAQALSLALEMKAGIKQPLPEKSPEVRGVLPQDIQKKFAGNYASLVGLAEIGSETDHFHLEVMDKTFHLVPRENGKFGVKYVFLGLIPFNIAVLDNYEISHAIVAGHEILRASIKSSNLLVAEKIQPVPVPASWQARAGKYSIQNLGNDVSVFEKIRLRYDGTWLFLECTMPFHFKGTYRFPLKPVTDTEAVLSGLGGRSMGETVRVVKAGGKELLSYSGYLLSRDD